MLVCHSLPFFTLKHLRSLLLIVAILERRVSSSEYTKLAGISKDGKKLFIWRHRGRSVFDHMLKIIKTNGMYVSLLY